MDDERANRIVFEQSLSEFSVLTAPDAQSALALFDVHDIAVLVTDMRMPVMSGEELLRVVKEKHPQTLRMVITAHTDIDPILRAINEGLVARYIIKPWQRTELIQVLRWACEAWTFGRDSAVLHRRLLETERLATLGSIAGMLVHDLKQPLTSLIANVRLVMELARSSATVAAALENAPIEPQLRARLATLVDDLGPVSSDINDSAMLLANMIDGLRHLGRGRADDDEAPTIDPLPVVRHAMAVCQELAMRAHTSIGYEGPRTLPAIRISPTELTQVLINVVANGTQAVAARGRGKVSILARDAGGMLELEVRDDGIGMAPEVLHRVGTPFFTTRSDGVGLGVAQCQRLIGAAGGRFRIDSEQGVGTVVTIILPTAA
ncbi:MAG: ATP-binding protein [Kofleriaceae bacterium]